MGEFENEEEFEDISLPKNFELTPKYYAYRDKERQVLISETLMLEICKTLYYYAEIVPNENADYGAARQLTKISNYNFGQEWAEDAKESSRSAEIAEAKTLGMTFNVDMGVEDWTAVVRAQKLKDGIIQIVGVDTIPRDKREKTATEVQMNLSRGNSKDLDCWPPPSILRKECDCGGHKAGTTHSHWCSRKN